VCGRVNGGLRGRDGVPVCVRMSAGVSEVRAKTSVLSDGEVLPYGVAVWAAGERTRNKKRRLKGQVACACADISGSIRGQGKGDCAF
jgi:hypothetical protein